MSDDHFEGRAAEMHDAFVRAFAEARAASETSFAALLAIRVAGEPYALRVSEVAEITAARRVVPVPTRLPAFLGLAGVHGTLVSVFSLAALLGHTQPVEETRYLALHAGGRAQAFAFGGLDAFVRVPEDAVHADARRDGPRVVRLDGLTRPLIDLGSMAGALEQRTRAGARSEGS